MTSLGDSRKSAVVPMRSSFRFGRSILKPWTGNLSHDWRLKKSIGVPYFRVREALRALAARILEYQQNLSAILIVHREKNFEYVCIPRVSSIYRTQKINPRKKYYLFPGGGAPLEGGAPWIGHPSFYVSLVPGRECILSNICIIRAGRVT